MESRSIYQFPFSRYPAVRLALLLISGILIYKWYQISAPATLLLFLGILVLFQIVEWFNKRKISRNISIYSTVIFFMAVIVFGMFRMAVKTESDITTTEKLLQIMDWESVQVRGKVMSITTTATGKERWDVKSLQTQIDSLISTESIKIRVLADDYRSATTTDVSLGDTVLITGRLIPISEKRNPHDFDYKGYLASQDIQAQLKADSLINSSQNDQKLEWIWWREKALNIVENNFTENTAPIAKALLVGYKQDLDTESKSAFARSGLSHIMAVSGLHVGFLVAPFWVIIPWFWTKKYGKQVGLVLLVMLLLCYAGITGFSPSVMRASVMAFFLSYGKLFHKLNDSLNLTAGAALVLLIINPAQLFDIGFQLSFSAVYIILLVIPTLQNILPYWVRVRWYGKPLMVVIISIVVQVGLYPLQVFYFGEISLISPLANALFVPLLGIIVPLSLVSIFISAMYLPLGYVMNYPSLIFISWMHDFVTTASKWEWAWATAHLESALIFVFWVFLIFTVASIYISALRWKMLIGALTVLCVMTFVEVKDKFVPAGLLVTYFDVGQGDAALIQTPAGKNILIDVGTWSPTYNSGRSVILPHLRAENIEQLDAVILSHPHADHIGGIVDLIEEIPIHMIYNSGFEYDSELYNRYITRAHEKGVQIKALRAGDTLGIDPAMLFLVLGPEGQIFNSDPNEHSIVMNVIYGHTEFLFTGDAGHHQEQRLIRQYQEILDTDVLKVGHHGSRTSSGSEFLKWATPDVAVVSLSESNRFRHPHREAILRLRETNADILYTSIEKAVILYSDGENVKQVDW